MAKAPWLSNKKPHNVQAQGSEQKRDKPSLKITGWFFISKTAEYGLIKMNRVVLDPKFSAFLFTRYNLNFFPKVTRAIDVHNPGAAFEQYTQYLPGQLMPLGSYSYSQSYFSHVTTIGRYCSIGKNVSIMGEDHPLDWLSSNPVFYRERRARLWGSHRKTFPVFDSEGERITIGHDVWIGDNVTLSRGITLGTGCMIATGSIVTKDVPPYAVVGGVPAKVIRYRFAEHEIADLLALKWWKFPLHTWDDCDVTSPSDVIRVLKNKDSSLEELPEKRMTISALYKEFCG